MKRLPLRHCALSSLLACKLLWAADPEPATTAVSTAPEPTAQAASTAPNASPSTTAELSSWLQTFPAERKRQLADRTMVVWPPRRLWRGDLIMLPGAGNAVHYNGPLLQLAERLAQAGWRCWLLARDRQTEGDQETGGDLSATPELMSRIRVLIAAEPQPSIPTVRPDGLLPFVIAQADAATLAWAEATAEPGQVAGVILLGAGQLPDSAPKQSVLELQIAEQAAGVAAAAKSRQANWQHLMQYQQQTLLSSSRLPTIAWLDNAIDGWLRKIAKQQARSVDDSMKRQITAQPAPGAQN